MADAEGSPPFPSPSPPAKRSDLGVRVLSGVVMVGAAAAALWLGGLIWVGLVLLVVTVALWEWVQLSRAIATGLWPRVAWLAGGVIYLGQAAGWLAALRIRGGGEGVDMVLWFIAPVVATDIGAYCAGRSFGGPKIAPGISPGKTWAGLVGGIVAATITIRFLPVYDGRPFHWQEAMAMGPLAAIVAQAGDFFESWMKRRAGVKDSGHLIPGHGGVLDRIDGLLAVLLVASSISFL